MKAKVLLSTGLLLFGIFLAAGCSNAGGIDNLLNKAKNEGKVVMLELGSKGCIPCEQMKPIMEDLKTNYKGKLEVIFVDIREDGKTGQKFKVFMIPTQVFLDKSGKEFHRHLGFYPYEEIDALLKQNGL